MDLPLPHATAPAPFRIELPARVAGPVVFASPHSGRSYPAHFVASARLDLAGLRRSEDSFVDELFGAAPALGAPLIAADFPRAYCDPNREKWELDPAMFEGELPSWVNTTSARIGAGLGTIPRVVASGEPIYRGKLSFEEAVGRVRSCWEPYHEALSGLIAQTRLRFGACLLIDCHSMPGAGCGRASGTRRSPGGPDFVLGDAHGTTASPRITRAVERVLTEMGYAVRRNDPYAGGYVTRHYGRPREGVHALQIEIARPLYMDEERIEKRPGFGAVRRDIGVLMSAVIEGGAELLAG